MKKQYAKPFVAIETMEPEQQFLAGSIINSIDGGDTGIGYGGAGSGPAGSRGINEFADEIGE